MLQLLGWRLTLHFDLLFCDQRIKEPRPDFWLFEVGFLRGVWLMGSVEPVCEFCGVARAVVYCKQDMAALCLQCDGFVHSANFISQRHVRSLLCDKCNSQPATIQCLEDEACLCESCECNVNSCLSSEHKHQPLRFYSGSPSPEEFIQIWSSSPSCKSPVSLSTNCINSYWENRNNSRSLFWSVTSLTNRMKELETFTKMSSSPMSPPQALFFSSVPQLLKVISSIFLALFSFRFSK